MGAMSRWMAGLNTSGDRRACPPCLRGAVAKQKSVSAFWNGVGRDLSAERVLFPFFGSLSGTQAILRALVDALATRRLLQFPRSLDGAIAGRIVTLSFTPGFRRRLKLDRVNDLANVDVGPGGWNALEHPNDMIFDRRAAPTLHTRTPGQCWTV